MKPPPICGWYEINVTGVLATSFWFMTSEDIEWLGIKNGMPCKWFQVTTVNQETAEVSGEPLTMLGTFRAGKMMSLTQSKAKVTFFIRLRCMLYIISQVPSLLMWVRKTWLDFHPSCTR
jgi:hypothetical protein